MRLGDDRIVLALVAAFFVILAAATLVVLMLIAVLLVRVNLTLTPREDAHNRSCTRSRI